MLDALCLLPLAYPALQQPLFQDNKTEEQGLKTFLVTERMGTDCSSASGWLFACELVGEREGQLGQAREPCRKELWPFWTHIFA